MTGTEVCYWHSGNGNANSAALAVVGGAMQQAKQSLPMYGVPIQVAAEDALEGELHRTAGHVAWLQEALACGDPAEFVKSLWTARRTSGFVREDEVADYAWDAAQALWLELYTKERERLVKVAATMLSAGFEERKVKLLEQQADLVGQRMQAMLTELGLDTNDPSVRAIAFKHLAALTAGETIEGEVDHG